jgi:peptidyl-prolyl cis-trans isomerase C
MPRPLQPMRWNLIPRLPVLAAAGVLLAAAGPAQAPPANKGQTAPPATQQPKPDANQAGQSDTATQGAPTDAGDRVVAVVEGHPIHLSELGQAEQALPADMRNMPLESLYPVLLNLMVDHQALAMLARRRGLEDNLAVRQQIQQATDRVLEGALLGADAAPKVTEDAIKARFDQLYANRAETEQVHARHILVATEAEANKIIAQLKQGADFATLAQQYSKDPDARRGGDLGFFGRNQVLPGFGEVAFALQPGQVADKPIHNEFGWHVVKVEERRMAPPPSLAEVHDALRQQLMQEAVRQEVALARGQLTIHEWNLNGTPIDLGQPVAGTPDKPK